MLIFEQPDESLMEMTRSEMPEISSGAFDEITGRYQNRLLAGAYCRIRNRATCEDIVQNTLIAVWQERFVFDKTIAKFSTWVYNILKNQIDKYLRDSQKERDMISLSRVEEDKDDFLAVCDFAGDSEIKLAKLHEVVLKYLKGDEQKLYKLREIDKLKYKDIVRLPEYEGTGIDEETLMKRIQRCKHKIIKMLEKYDKSGR
jgi:RNA polymerase sigma factor (sigma-70 family)